MLHIKSTHPALLSIDKDYLLQSPIDKASFDTQNLTIKYYPLDKSINGKIAIPTLININQNNLRNCPEYDIIKYPQDNIEIILKPFLITNNICPEKTTHKIDNSQKTLAISSDKASTISLQNGNDYLYFTYPAPLNFFRGIEIDNICHIIFQSKDYIYAQIKNNKLSIYDDIKSATFDQNKFTAIIPYFDMAKSGKVVKINFSKPYLFAEKDIYINNKPKLITNEKLIPYAFLESVKSKNYKLARHYISKNMQEKLTDNILSDFFGDILSICQDTYNDKICVIQQENDVFIAKDYSFEVKNGKINNIMQL